jgi:hypothetical protein
MIYVVEDVGQGSIQWYTAISNGMLLSGPGWSAKLCTVL